MARVAFIGLGIMGGPMAANLVRAGHDVTGYNRSRPALDRLIEAGGRSASSIAQAVSEAEIVITMVPDSTDVEEVALGEGGIYANSKPGTLHIDCSTILPDVARLVAQKGEEMGIRVLDAPVSGGEVGAIEADPKTDGPITPRYAIAYIKGIVHGLHHQHQLHR